MPQTEWRGLLLKEFRCAVRRAIVNHDDFKFVRGKALTGERFKTTVQFVFAVKGWNHDRDRAVTGFDLACPFLADFLDKDWVQLRQAKLGFIAAAAGSFKVAGLTVTPLQQA